MKANLFVLVLPLALCVAGCNEKNNGAADTSSTSTATNAAATAVDNSGQNVRDREHATVTPVDQGGSPADRDLTQKIRQACVSGTNNFSVAARNIKIVTVNGKVTLRGPVNTDAEKTSIVAIAKSVAGDANVEDQLEVKANP
jgi:osmotically-inducible protein OsmY